MIQHHVRCQRMEMGMGMGIEREEEAIGRVDGGTGNLVSTLSVHLFIKVWYDYDIVLVYEWPTHVHTCGAKVIDSVISIWWAPCRLRTTKLDLREEHVGMLLYRFFMSWYAFRPAFLLLDSLLLLGALISPRGRIVRVRRRGTKANAESARGKNAAHVVGRRYLPDCCFRLFFLQYGQCEPNDSSLMRTC